MVEHQLTCNEKTDFYMFSNKGIFDEIAINDTYPISYDLKNFPTIERPNIETQFVKRH